MRHAAETGAGRPGDQDARGWLRTRTRARRRRCLLLRGSRRRSGDRDPRGDPPRAAAAAVDALQLWRGDPYPELPEWPPAEAEVRRLCEIRETAEDVQVEGTPEVSALQTAILRHDPPLDPPSAVGSGRWLFSPTGLIVAAVLALSLSWAPGWPCTSGNAQYAHPRRQPLPRRPRRRCVWARSPQLRRTRLRAARLHLAVTGQVCRRLPQPPSTPVRSWLRRRGDRPPARFVQALCVRHSDPRAVSRPRPGASGVPGQGVGRYGVFLPSGGA